MEDKDKKYYEYLKSKGVDVAPTFESFQSTLQDDIKREKYYNYLKTKGVDVAPTYESFTKTLVKPLSGVNLKVDTSKFKDVKDLAIKNNNPGNLREPGSKKGFRSFPSLEEGYNALIEDIRIKKSDNKGYSGLTGDSTLEQLISKYAPANENDTNNYLKVFLEETGYTKDTKLKDADEKLLAKAIIRNESSTLYKEMFGLKKKDGTEESASEVPSFSTGLDINKAFKEGDEKAPLIQLPEPEYSFTFTGETSEGQPVDTTVVPGEKQSEINRFEEEKQKVYSELPSIVSDNLTYIPESKIEDKKRELRDKGYSDQAIEQVFAEQKVKDRGELGKNYVDLQVNKEISGRDDIGRETKTALNSVMYDALETGQKMLSENDKQVYEANKVLIELNSKENLTPEELDKREKAKKIRDEAGLTQQYFDWKTFRHVDEPTETSVSTDVINEYKTRMSQMTESQLGQAYLGYYGEMMALKEKAGEKPENGKYNYVVTNPLTGSTQRVFEYNERGEKIDNELMDATLRFKAANDLLLVNRSPQDIKKDMGLYAGEFLKSAGNVLLGDDVMKSFEAMGKGFMTDRAKLDMIQQITSEKGLSLSPEEEDNLQRNFVESASEMAGGLAGFMVMMAPLNAAGKVSGITKGIESMMSSSNGFKKLGGWLLKGVEEEAKFFAVSPSHYKPGMGAGLAFGSRLVPGIPIANNDISRAIVPYFNTMMKASVGATTGMELGAVMETTIDALWNNKDIQYRLDEAGFGNLDDVKKRIALELTVNGMLGFMHLNSVNKAQKELKKYEELQKSLPEGSNEYKTVQKGIDQLKNVLNIVKDKEGEKVVPEESGKLTLEQIDKAVSDIETRMANNEPISREEAEGFKNDIVKELPNITDEIARRKLSNAYEKLYNYENIKEVVPEVTEPVKETIEPPKEVTEPVVESKEKEVVPEDQVKQEVKSEFDKAIKIIESDVNKVLLNKINDIESKIDKSEKINEKEIESAKDYIIDLMDKVKDKDILDALNETYDKLDTYEFTTETKTEKVIKGREIKVLPRNRDKAKRISEERKRILGREVDPGDLKKGEKAVIEMKDDGLIIQYFKGGKRTKSEILNAEELSDLKLGEISFDEYGNVFGIEIIDRDGKKIKLNDSEVAIDLALEKKEAELGRVPIKGKDFDIIYEDIIEQRNVEILKPKKELKPIIEPKIKQDAKELESRPVREQGQEKEGKSVSDKDLSEVDRTKLQDREKVETEVVPEKTESQKKRELKEKEITDRLSETLKRLSNVKQLKNENPLKNPDVFKDIVSAVSDLIRLGEIKVEKGMDHVLKVLSKKLPKKYRQHLPGIRKELNKVIKGKHETYSLDKLTREEEIALIKKSKEAAAERAEKRSKEIIEKFKGKEIEDKTDLRNALREALANRVALVGTKAFDTKIIREDLKKRLTKEELESIPFLIEKTVVPKELNRPELEEIVKNPSKELMESVDLVKEYFDEAWKFITENTESLSAEQIKDYVTHIWDIPKNKIDGVSSWFTTKNRFLKKRYIESIAEGIKEFGLTPKTLDITDILEIHNATTTRAIANKIFIDEVKSFGKDGHPMVMPMSVAPVDYVEINHPALTGNKVHPDLAPALKSLFSSRLDHPVFNVIEKVNHILKKSNLSLSFFHHIALSETLIPLVGIKKALEIINKSIIESVAKKERPAFLHKELTRDFIEHTGQVGASKDFDVAGIQRQLNELAEKYKDEAIRGNATKLLKTFNEKWDRALWDYLHDGFKIFAWEHLVSKMPKDIIKPEEIKKYKQEMAQLVNDTFGGQNMEMLFIGGKPMSKATQQLLGMVMLSSDWFISTTRQALSPFGVGSLYKSKGYQSLFKKGTSQNIRGKRGAMFWVKAALYYGIGMNAINVVNRIQDKKEHPEFYPKDMKPWDYTMFGNSIGSESKLFMDRYEDGSERYLRWGKQFRELFELLFDEGEFNPILASKKKIGGKASPVLQLGSNIMTGRSLSEYENWDMRDKKGYEKTLGILITIAKAPFPFSANSALFRGDKEFKITDVAMPSGKGMTKSKAINLFKYEIAEAMDSGSYNEKAIAKIYASAVRNNLDAVELFKSAMSLVKAEGTRELKEGIKNIDDLNEKLKEEGLTLSEKKKLLDMKKKMLTSQARKQYSWDNLDRLIQQLNNKK